MVVLNLQLNKWMIADLKGGLLWKIKLIWLIKRFFFALTDYRSPWCGAGQFHQN